METSSNQPSIPTSPPASLEHARISSLPAAAYYIADFISEEEEKLILEKVRCSVVLLRSYKPFANEGEPRSLPLPNLDGNSLPTEDSKPGRPTSSKTRSSTRNFPSG